MKIHKILMYTFLLLLVCIFPAQSRPIFFVGGICGINHFSISTTGTSMRASGIGYTIGPKIEVYDTKSQLGLSLDILYEVEKTIGTYWESSQDKVIRIPLLGKITILESKRFNFGFGLGVEIYYILESNITFPSGYIYREKEREGKTENFFTIEIFSLVDMSSKIKIPLKLRVSRSLTANTVSNATILESLQLLIGVDYRL